MERDGVNGLCQFDDAGALDNSVRYATIAASTRLSSRRCGNMPPTTKYLTLLRFVTCSVAVMVCAVLFLFAVQGKATLAQQPLADFNIYTQTSLTVTVILADGQRAVVPVLIDYSIEHRKGLGYVKMDAHVEQQPGLVLAVAESSYINASMEAVVYRAPLVPVVVAPPTPTIAPAIVIVAPTPLPTPLPPVVPTTAIPTAQFTAEEVAFVAKVQELLGGYNQASDMLFIQFAALEGNPAVILDQEWIFKTATGLALLKSMNESMRALVTPSRFTEAGFELQLAANWLDRAVTAYTTAIDELNVNEMSVGNQLVAEAAASLSKAKRLLGIP